MSRYQGQYDGAMNRTRQTGAAAEDEYLRRTKEFDAQSAVETSAMGQYNSFRDMLNRDLGTMRGRQAATGQSNTGYAVRQEDRLVEGGIQDLNNRIMANANHAVGLDLANTQGLGQFGQNQSGQFYDLLAGGMDRETAEKNARRQMWGGIINGVAGAAGTVLGGPAGGALAGGISKWLQNNRGGAAAPQGGAPAADPAPHYRRYA
jgi:hypothetical protein